MSVAYFPVVFTLSAQIVAIAFQNKAAVFTILFKAASETVRTIAADPRHLTAEIGLIAALRSWGQTLTYNPQLHCIVPGGGVSTDGTRLISCSPGFLCPCTCCRACFAAAFWRNCDAGRLGCFGDLAHLAPDAFSPKSIASNASSTPSHLSAGRNGCSPISAATSIASRWPKPADQHGRRSRCLPLANYRRRGKTKVMTLDAHEFIRRFLLHLAERLSSHRPLRLPRQW